MSGMDHMLVIGVGRFHSLLQNVIELRNPDPEQPPQPVNKQPGGVSIVVATDRVGKVKTDHCGNTMTPSYPLYSFLRIHLIR